MTPPQLGSSLFFPSFLCSFGLAFFFFPRLGCLPLYDASKGGPGRLSISGIASHKGWDGHTGGWRARSEFPRPMCVSPFMMRLLLPPLSSIPYDLTRKRARTYQGGTHSHRNITLTYETRTENDIITSHAAMKKKLTLSLQC